MSMSPRLLRPKAASGFDPRSISGLGLWLDFGDSASLTLSGSAISEARDKSGNSRHAVQATGANQPTVLANAINGRQVASFDGSNDSLAVSSFPALTQMTAFAVCYRDWTSRTQFRTVFSSGYAGTAGMAAFVHSSSTTLDIVANDLFSFGNGFQSGRAPRQIGAVGTRSANVPLVMSVSLASSGSGQWINGASVSERVSSSGEMNVASGTLSIATDGLGAFADYKIAEVIVYTSALSASQRQFVERSLGQKYAITVSA